MVILKGLGKITKIAIVVIVIILGFLFWAFVLPLITESPPAVLLVESGSVQVAQSPLRPASSGVQLKSGDEVVTGQGRASVVFFGSSVVRLEENTSVKLSELNTEKGSRGVKIKQDSGRMWSKVIKLSGFSNYQVETPSSVATLRGTAFDSLVAGNATSISVVEGIVNIESKLTGQSIDIKENQSTDVSAGLPLAVRALIEDGWIRDNVQRDEQFLIELRERLKAKYWMYLLIAKTAYGLTDEQIDEYIDGALRGAYTQEQIQAGLDNLGIEIKP